MNKLDEQYRGILAELLYNGKEKGDRTGTGTLSKFGMQIRHNMKDGFPLLTTKKIAVKTMMTELKWFLKGDTNIKYLVDNNCNIWNGDAYKNFLKKSVPHDHQETKEEFINKIKTDNEFAEKWGELGPIYGKQWRSWTEYYVEKFNGGNPVIVERTSDQIENLINDLKSNPDSRRLMVNAWNVGELEDMALTPCHCLFQFYVADGKLSCQLYQRSADTFLGVPFNIASYALLTMMLAEVCDLEYGEFVHTFGDVHLYTNHLEQAELQLTRDFRDLPKMTIRKGVKSIYDFEFEDFKLEGYDPHPHIKAAVSV